MKTNSKVFVNHVLLRALHDSKHLPKPFKDTLVKLSKLGQNPGIVVKTENVSDGFVVILKVGECYSSNSTPAVMSEAYNGGQGTKYWFETVEQAELLLSEKNNIETVELLNLSSKRIEAPQLVRLLYNNKNIVILPVDQLDSIEDYHGIIGQAIGPIDSYTKGLIKLLSPCQTMNNHHFLKLTIRGLRGF